MTCYQEVTCPQCNSNPITQAGHNAYGEHTHTILAYMFGKRKDDVFKKLKELLEPFGIQRDYTDD